MRLIKILTVPLLLLGSQTVGSQSAAAQVAPAWGDGAKVTQLTTEIATTQLMIEMCKLDAKQVVDDGNTVFELIKELHPRSYEAGWKRARADFAKAQQQPDEACQRASDTLPRTSVYYARLAENVRPLLNK